jgi:hypothetical protein
MTRNDIVEQAREYLFVPFLPRGRSKRGLDCLGLACVIADHFRVHYVDMPDYDQQPHPNRMLLTIMRQFLKPMPIDGELTGCLGVFAMVRLPCHIGFFSMQRDRQYVIHTRVDCGVAEELYDADVAKSQFRVISVHAFPEMEV